jgi:four helix bundle protein
MLTSELRSEVKEVHELQEVKDGGRIGPIKKYGELLVYKQAYRLALAVSRFTKRLPREEQFELGRQHRRSATSIPANIVEGWTKRNSAADFKRHLLIASSEAAETRFWIELSLNEGLSNRDAAEDLAKEYSRLSFMIHNLWKEWRKL